MALGTRLARRLLLAIGPIGRLHADRGALRRSNAELQRQVEKLRARQPGGVERRPDAATVRELDFLTVTADDVLRWDREWCRYLSRVEGSRYFTSKLAYTKRELALGERIGTLTRDELYNTRGPMSDLRIWYDGADLARKKVAEIGCGPSQLGRDLAPVVAEYVGLDYSDLALSIARLTCADNCRFCGLWDKERIRELRGTRDTIICRHFFIHQNLGNARWVLRLANYLLRDGGVIVADFYWPDSNYEEGSRRGSIRPSTDPLRDFASTMFLFTDEQIRALAEESGFTIDAESFAEDLPRRHVRLIKVRSAT